MIRVGLVDDQELIVEGLTAILESAPDVQVVFRGGDGQQLLDALARGIVMDVVLVDIRMPRMDGLEATRRMAELPVRPAVVVLTTFDDDELVVAALQAGAVGFMLKRATRHELLDAVHAAAVGDAMLSPSVARTVIARLVAGLPGATPPRCELPELTARELDVLRGIGNGLTNAEISRALFLSESTVKTHVSSVLAKTRSRDRVHAALLAVRSGLVTA